MKILFTLFTALGLCSCQIHEADFEKHYGPLKPDAETAELDPAYMLKDPAEAVERRELMKTFRNEASRGNVYAYKRYRALVKGSGESILHLAAFTNSVEDIKQELAYGVNIDARTLRNSLNKRLYSDPYFPGKYTEALQTDYETPLHYAARANAMEAYAYLLKRDANKYAKDSKRRKPEAILEQYNKKAP